MFNLGERPGILGNLVFSNISGVVDELGYEIVPGDTIELPVPAVLVDVNCTALSNDMFIFRAKKLEYVDDRIGSLLPIWYSPNSQSFLNSNDSLWPTETTSLNFFELLATYAEYEAKNISSLLDTDGFARATTEMFTAYTVQLLTELRPAAVGTPRNANATIAMQRERISQHLTSTIVVEVLLASVLCCLTWIALRFPRSAILPKDPDSVAARFSLLAGSRLVQRLREDPSARQREDGIWSEKSGLGWWPTSGSERTWRWGIDVGDDMVKQDWKHPPAEASVGETAQSTSEEALDVAAFENAAPMACSAITTLNQDYLFYHGDLVYRKGTYHREGPDYQPGLDHPLTLYDAPDAFRSS
ncbi:hypothetical protein UCDDS831_g03146 [Diplodia seriata]|uniref:Uncharacterized protein n=1 Tax=Diplodia seriata TaxID=420778 RepID=A0A0G2H3S9_9PEZI|nr:hypothetical protein UCDDS831_g03146 [Diplodia seriata]